jgi:hypothetical protein
MVATLYSKKAALDLTKMFLAGRAVGCCPWRLLRSVVLIAVALLASG